MNWDDMFTSHTEAIYTGWLAALIVLEQVGSVFPLPPVRSGGFARWSRNLVFGVINKFGLPLLFLPLLLWCVHVNLWIRPAWMMGAGGLFLDIVVLDVAGYWFHRLSHNLPFLWRFHQIHHLDEAMDCTTGFRVHWFERIIHNAIKFSIIIGLNIPLVHYVIYETIGAMHALFHHANLNLPRPVELVLRRIVTTPNFHWVHHHELQSDTDSNYGFIFSWWDALFGTYNEAQRTPQWRMGLDYSHDLPLLQLMFTPFHPVRLKYRATPPHTGAQTAAEAPE